MTRGLKWLVAIVAALVLFVVAVYLVSKAMGPTRAESEALALVDARPQQGAGRDGFAALYTASHDVPEAEQARVLAQDVRSFAATPPPTSQAPDASAWESALQEWPTLADRREGDPDWCSARAADCLERVRKSPEAYADLIQRNARLLDRIAALGAYDYFRSPFPPRFDMPVQANPAVTWSLTRNAWRFAHGGVDAALAGACSDAALGRRMIESGESLIGSMIGVAVLQGNATLVAQMLAELPRDHRLPAQCAQAFQPPMALTDGVCRTMLSEARVSIASMRAQVDAEMAASSTIHEPPSWTSRLLFDPDRTAARSAPTFAWYCGQQARELLAQDLPLRDSTPPPARWSVRCISNTIGCTLSDIARPAYADYGVRLQDADARLRTIGALLWLREQDGPMDGAALDRLPVPMRSPSRPLHLDPATGTLVTALYEKPRPGPQGHDGTWSVPLPGSRIQSAGASP